MNGQGGGTSTSESFRYFYHPDHLGSTSYVTDASGEVFQHLEYFAFGETFVEEHSNTDRTPYLFNGKELDEETGLYYYGARYYDARTSIFFSVDPMADKYPMVTPYSFAFNNPIKLIDPTGMDPEEPALLEEVTVTASRSAERKIDTSALSAIQQQDPLKGKVNREVPESQEPRGYPLSLKNVTLGEMIDAFKC